MDFPSFGDADQYAEIARACAQQISSLSLEGDGCYQAYRPIGIVLFYTLPFVFSADLITIDYLTLLLNILSFGIIITAGLSLIRQLSPSTHCCRIEKLFSVIGAAVFVVFSLVFSIGFLPVRLSDHQSLALFIASVAILASTEGKSDKLYGIIAGILAGMAVLFKQNYSVAVFFLFLVWLSVDRWRNPKQTLIRACWFAAGASIALLQVLWVYYHSGVPWLYEPAAMRVFNTVNAQPYVEMVAYNTPQKNAYWSQLTHSVSDFEYFAIKFYHGLTKFYWAVYGGVQPLEQTPASLTYPKVSLFTFEVIYVLTGIVSFAALASKERWLGILVVTAFLTVTLTTFLGHMESRYFYFFRMVYLIYAIVIAKRFAALCLKKRRGTELVL